MTDQESERPKRHLKPVPEGKYMKARSEIGTTTFVNWSSAWAGFIVSVGTLVFLGALGIGLNVGSSAGPQALSTNTLWAGSGLVIAMFIGGYITSSKQPKLHYAQAARQGAVLWGLTLTGGIVLVGFGGNAMTGFLKAVFVPQSATTAGGIIASFTILMLGSAILGATMGAWQSSGGKK